MGSQIGAQLYTLREYCKTAVEIGRTLARVREMGYEAVQCSGMGAIEPQELARILNSEGLVCAATHVALDRLENEPEKVIEEHALWGCRYTAIGGFGSRETGATAQTWIDFAKRYNAVAKKYAGSNLSIGYHNHSHELAKYDGKTALGILLEELDRSVWIEIDTYWIVHGGGDPIQWIERYKGRVPCVHLKDMGIKPDRTQFMAEVGEGNLNWEGILGACRDAGVQWYLVEQDVCYRDPFESLRISLENLRGLGLR